jgi:tRNA uridine 5-carboxymethylaminomethyl modification enzyme
MFTSRAEYRLLLRQDNADKRLMKYGHELGLVPKEVYSDMLDRYARIEKIKNQMFVTSMKPSEDLTELLQEKEIPNYKFGHTLASFLKRSDIKITDLELILPEIKSLNEEEKAVLEMEIKYEGYLKRELETIEYRKKFLGFKIPDDFLYENVKGLKTEAVLKLQKHRPMDLESALHISGVDPSDVDLLLYHLVDRR